MHQKVLKSASYAVELLVLKNMLFFSNYAKNYASTIRHAYPVVTHSAHFRYKVHFVWELL